MCPCQRTADTVAVGKVRRLPGDVSGARAPNAGRPGGWDDRRVTNTQSDLNPGKLLRRGFALEYLTLSWNVVGIVVLSVAAVSAGSVALAGFGMDSLIEIGASTVVLWELSGTGEHRQRRALRLIGGAFGLLAVYLLVASTVVLVAGYRPRHSVPGIIWTGATALVMFALAAGKARTGAALGNQVLTTEGRVTLIDAPLHAPPREAPHGKGKNARPPQPSAS
jgi:hypothetical protein